MPTEDALDLAAQVAACIADRLEARFAVIPTLTLSQVAEAIGVSEEKVRRLCHDGKIPFIKVDKLYRIKPADVNGYLEANYHGRKSR